MARNLSRAATLVTLAFIVPVVHAATPSQGSIIRGFAVGLLAFILLAPTALGAAIGLLGNPRERWLRGAFRGGATGLGSMVVLLLVLGALIRVT
jgi:hypothetical protein